MKIAIDARPINHNFRQGIFNYTEKLIYGLAEIDKDNAYFLLFTSLRKKYNQMPGAEQANFIKKVLRVPDERFIFKDFLLNNVFLPGFLKKNNCGVYHATSGYSLPIIKNVKKIITIHDLRSLRISDNTFPQNIESFKKAAKNADICIAVSECTKRDVVEFLKIPEDKIKVTYLGVDERFKVLEKDNLKFFIDKYNIKKRFFFSLGLVPRKNIERLLKAFSIFRYKNDFTLVLGGPGSSGPWMLKYYELVKKLHIEDKVLFIGYIPDSDLPLFYNASECFIFPSLYEGFGIPIIEAMRCGTPVITSNVASMPEIGSDAVLYVNPYEEDDIAKQMEKIIDDTKSTKELINKGILRAHDFSWQKMAKETLEIYNL